MIDSRQERISKPQLAARGALVSILLVLLGLAVTPVAEAQTQFTLTNLYSFTSKTVGWEPEAGLIQDSAGNFYGTTQSGGTHYTTGLSGGIVFEVSPTGTETTLYNFCGSKSGSTCLDGSNPHSTLLADSAGNLYGTLNTGGTGGGSQGYGAVFELSPAPSGGVCPSSTYQPNDTYQGNGWCEIVLYSFQNAYDGAYPDGKLISDSLGNLYSTTSGGIPGSEAICGAVFELSPPSSGSTWTENTVYTFAATGDACTPSAGLVFDGSGNLYGTAQVGGTGSTGNGTGNGAVYELSPAPSGGVCASGNQGQGWCESVQYSFTGGSDGSTPQSDLAYQGGNLYGTAYAGGSGGTGSVFELSPSGGTWTETTIFDFSVNTAQPQVPYAGVVFDPAGNLYGTAQSGASVGSGTTARKLYGAVYELSPPATPGGTWTETTAYAFGTNTTGDDRGPYGTVLLANGKLYGTTSLSNCAKTTCSAYGAVWSLTIPPPTVTVTSSSNPSLTTQSVIFTATIAPANQGTVTGTVAWSGSNGSMTCAESGTNTTSVTAGNPGVATCTTSSLPAGTDTITANYSGDNIHRCQFRQSEPDGQCARRYCECRFHFKSVYLWPERELYGYGDADERIHNTHWNRAV